MALTTTNCTSYVGFIDDIPHTASPGLLFLQKILPALDSLDSRDVIISLCSPSAIVINNANEPVPTVKPPREMVGDKFTKRAASLTSIHRELHRAWDIDMGNGQRTVIYESRNHYYFKADPKADVVMAEAGTIGLEPVHESLESSRGLGGFWATELRSWHDPASIRRKREELGC
jgi:hypothetical protein